MRGADGGPWRRLCALPALWVCFLKLNHQVVIFFFNVLDFNCTATELQVGLLYDETSLQNVLDMTADWTREERQMLRNKVDPLKIKISCLWVFFNHCNIVK